MTPPAWLWFVTGLVLCCGPVLLAVAWLAGWDNETW